MGGLRFGNNEVINRHFYGYGYVGTRLAVSAKHRTPDAENIALKGETV